jgi:hypothetical protein
MDPNSIARAGAGGDGLGLETYPSAPASAWASTAASVGCVGIPAARRGRVATGDPLGIPYSQGQQ